MAFENRHVGCKEREKINRRHTLCTLRINFFEATPQTACIFSKDDEHAQQVYIRYGNGVETRYKYDEKRRWLDTIETENKQNQDVFQKIKYSFDPVGNVLGYTNEASTYETTQAYKYDNLYQLISVEGESKQYKGKKYFGMSPVNIAKYKQEFNFDIIGNMMNKMSTTNLSGSRGNAYKKADLDYNLDYEYDSKYAHRLIRAGNRYYRYDGNGNITAEKDGPFSEEEEFIFTYNYDKESGVYSTDYGFGLDAPKETEQTNPQDLFAYRRNYMWNERNLLTKSSDKNYTVHYRYGEDGQRALKYTEEGRSETLYFNNFFTIHIPIYDKDNPQGLRVHKHIFVGNSRLVTAMTHTDNHGDNDEQKEKRYYYHSDHLGSAQFVTDWKGRQYEHIEYTPYGELWVEETAPGIDKLPFRFTGKELDEETGLYYYGARYLDPKYSRWLSGDPALNDYIPKAPIDDEAKKHNENLPGMGGVFNVVNLHVYHYAGNNPVKYVDPDGREIFWVQGDGVSDQDFKKIQNYAKEIVASNTEAGKRFAYLINSKDSLVVINVKTSGDTNAAATNWDNAQNGKGSDTIVNININDIGKYKDGIQKDLRASLVHEISGHAYSNAQGTSTYDGSGKSKKTSREQWMGLFYEEQKAVAMENEYRNFIGLPQRAKYQNLWDMPLYNKETNSWFVKPGEFDAFGGYRSIPGGAAERWK